MSEFIAQVPSPEPEDYLLPVKSVRHWAKTKTLSPVIQDASIALQKQCKKTPREISCESAIEPRDGIFITPEFQGWQLHKIGQGRSEGDLLARGGSAHQVSFGIVEVRDATGKLCVVNVAIKQFSIIENALQDIQNNVIALERGFKTTHPIGVIAHEGQGFALSIARKDVKSLDTEPWHQYKTGNEQTKLYFMRLLYRLSIVLANLNSSGIRHSDAQLKNFWVTPRGNVEAIDWEAGTIYDQSPNTEEFLTSASDDLTTLYKSLNGEFSREFPVEVITGSGRERWNQFNDLVLDHYMKQVFNNFIEKESISDDELLQILNTDSENQSEESLINTLRRTVAA